MVALDPGPVSRATTFEFLLAEEAAVRAGKSCRAASRPNPGRSSARETVLKPAVSGMPAPTGLKNGAWDFAVVPRYRFERRLLSEADIDLVAPALFVLKGEGDVVR